VRLVGAELEELLPLLAKIGRGNDHAGAVEEAGAEGFSDGCAFAAAREAGNVGEADRAAEIGAGGLVDGLNAFADGGGGVVGQVVEEAVVAALKVGGQVLGAAIVGGEVVKGLEGKVGERESGLDAGAALEPGAGRGLVDSGDVREVGVSMFEEPEGPGRQAVGCVAVGGVEDEAHVESVREDGEVVGAETDVADLVVLEQRVGKDVREAVPELGFGQVGGSRNCVEEAHARAGARQEAGDGTAAGFE